MIVAAVILGVGLTIAVFAAWVATCIQEASRADVVKLDQHSTLSP